MIKASSQTSVSEETGQLLISNWKAYELSTLTGTQVMLLVASETGHVYTFATKKLQPMITSDAGKNLIKACLNSADEYGDKLACSSNVTDLKDHNNELEQVFSVLFFRLKT